MKRNTLFFSADVVMTDMVMNWPWSIGYKLGLTVVKLDNLHRFTRICVDLYGLPRIHVDSNGFAWIG